MTPDLSRLVEQGLSDQQIADRLGVTARTVQRWRSRLTIPSRWTPTPAAHGTRSRYVRGCRCDACTQANTTYAALTRAAHRRARTARQEARTT